MAIVEGCTNPMRKMNVSSNLLVYEIKLYCTIVRPCQVWEFLLHALSVVVATSIFTETQHVFLWGTLWTLSTTFWDVWEEHKQKGTNPSKLMLLGLGDTIKPTSWRSWNEQRRYYWRKLLPSREKHGRSTSKTSKMGLHINFKRNENGITKPG